MTAIDKNVWNCVNKMCSFNGNERESSIKENSGNHGVNTTANIFMSQLLWKFREISLMVIVIVELKNVIRILSQAVLCTMMVYSSVNLSVNRSSWWSVLASNVFMNMPVAKIFSDTGLIKNGTWRALRTATIKVWTSQWCIWQIHASLLSLFTP